MQNNKLKNWNFIINAATLEKKIAGEILNLYEKNVTSMCKISANQVTL